LWHLFQKHEFEKPSYITIFIIYDSGGNDGSLP
jgi:hypothetical protein